MKLKEKEGVKGWGDENHNVDSRVEVRDPGDGLCFHRILYDFQVVRQYSFLNGTCCALWMHRSTKRDFIHLQNPSINHV